MGDIKAGVVAVTKFCRPGNEKYQKYIDYIDRDDAARTEHNSEYNLYTDYMDNPEKTTGLFTADRDHLSETEKKKLKEGFSIAKENNSIMWQTVISFDNRWLKENGLYDADGKILDERKMKEVSRNAITKMLKNEGLENALWSASIHYNTDNIHIHIATVEPEPMREKKEYIQYHTVEHDGVKKREPILGTDGKPVVKEEYVGRFKQKSIEVCKSTVVNQILKEADNNKKINDIIRGSILAEKKNNPLVTDAKLKEEFLHVYHSLPDVKRNLWNYNNNSMAEARAGIDQLSRTYLQKYHKEEFERLRDLIRTQAARYRQSYGKNEKDYEETKMKDLYTRLGNAILKEMREYDRKLQEGTVRDLQLLDKDWDQKDIYPEPEELEELEDNWEPNEQTADEDFLEHAEVGWSKEYKQIKHFLYKEHDYRRALPLLQRDHNNGLSVYELGNLYQFGRGVKIDREAAQRYYKKALQIFQKVYKESDDNEFLKSYLPYRIGKQYFYGQGAERDYSKARLYFEDAAKKGNQYAQYSLGNIYYEGKGVETDYVQAIKYHKKASELGNGYADYKLGKMYEEGSGIKADKQMAQNYYKKSYDTFTGMIEIQKDDNLEYRIGMMLLQGKGVEQNPAQALKYLESAAEAGNPNATYQIAKLKIESGEKEELLEAVKLLEELAEKGKMNIAQSALGKLYTDPQNVEIYHFQKGEKYLQMAVAGGNQYAAYHLGKLYASEQNEHYDLGKAVKYLKQADLKRNKYAQYTLGKLYLAEDQNRTEGLKLLERSADAGFVPAQYKLGRIYTDGQAEEFNFEKGMVYLTMAAQEENPYAQLSLGLIYLKGEYCKRNIEIAKEWLQKSTANGNEIAEKILDNINQRGYSGEMHPRRKAVRTGAALERTLRSLKRSLKKEWEKEKNDREHEQMIGLGNSEIGK